MEDLVESGFLGLEWCCAKVFQKHIITDWLNRYPLCSRWVSRVREADPTALAELSNAVSVKDGKYTVRDSPSHSVSKCDHVMTCILDIQECHG